MFKIGDRVVCVDVEGNNADRHLEVGKEYIVVVEPTTDDATMCLEGVYHEWKDSRFVLASEYNKVEAVEEEDTVEAVNSALAVQEGGTHYKKCGIQPVEYIQANGLDYFQGNVVKYVTRHKDKNGREDIKKAIHYLQLILELQYGEKQ